VDPAKIGKIIGRGGETIRGLIEEFGLKNANVDEAGFVLVTCSDRDQMDACAARIKELTSEDQRPRPSAAPAPVVVEAPDKRQFGKSARRRSTAFQPAPRRQKDVATVKLNARGATTANKVAGALGVGIDVVRRALAALGSEHRRRDAAIDGDTAELVALELGRTLEVVRAVKAARVHQDSVEEVDARAALARADGLEQKARDAFEAAAAPYPCATSDEWSALPLRPPTVAVLGHVDHGKTTLLDALRGATTTEAGGITQKLSAFAVDGATFLDTPGHAAFASMRRASARAVDCGVVVVAADDGVMPQTREAVAQCREAQAQVVVCVTKSDVVSNLEDAVTSIRRQLLDTCGLATEQDGGDAPLVRVAARTGDLGELRATLDLVAEISDLRADPRARARGAVLDASSDARTGLTVDAVVRWGTLQRGDVVVCGAWHGKVRSVVADPAGLMTGEGPPGAPVRFSAALSCEGEGPLDGAFAVVADAATAKRVAALRGRALAARRSAGELRTVADRVAVPADEDEDGGDEEPASIIKPPLIVKVATDAEAQACAEALRALPSSRAEADLIRCEVGVVTPSDVELAATFGAPIYAFNVGASGSVREACRRRDVAYARHDIVYSLVDDVAAYLSAQLPPDKTTTVVARAEVLQLFTLSNASVVIGCRVTDGPFPATAGVRVSRLQEIVATDARGVSSLRRVKDVVSEVAKGLECGVGLHSAEAAALVQEGDVLEAFVVTEAPAALDGGGSSNGT